MPSTDQRAYSSYLKAHEAKYGKKPAYIEVDYRKEVMPKPKQILSQTKILASFEDNLITVVTDDGNIYECESTSWGWRALKILDKKAYSRYEMPMPYNVYIAG